MGKTDKTRPWWVQMADARVSACVPVHDHRFGGCTLPAVVSEATASLGQPRSGCHWAGAVSYWFRRCESRGHREWAFRRREDRRRDRRAARRALREHLG